MNEPHKSCFWSASILVGCVGLHFSNFLLNKWLNTSTFSPLNPTLGDALEPSNSPKYFNLLQAQGRKLTESLKMFLTWESPGLIKSPDILLCH